MLLRCHMQQIIQRTGDINPRKRLEHQPFLNFSITRCSIIKIEMSMQTINRDPNKKKCFTKHVS